MKTTNLIILASLMASTTALANTDAVSLVSATKEVRLLSECANSLAAVSSDNSWVGSIEKVGIEDGQNSYSYTFNVYSFYGLGSRIKLGSVTVAKEYISNPPADSSSFRTHCSYEVNDSPFSGY